MTDAPVGRTSWARPATPYELFCDAQGVPVYRGAVGYRDVREIELGEWSRMGGRGAVLDLDGTGGKFGMYLIEVPSGGSLEPEHHLYEEIFYVVEGRGSTEIWLDGDAGKRVFEWGKSSVFSPPLNTWHRIVNATMEPALIIVITNAPPIMELYRNQDFIFNTSYHFKDRYDASDTYFDAWDELATDKTAHRALYAGAAVPDGANMLLPLDGNRGAGHRHTGLILSGNLSGGFIAEYPPGRYSKTHAHPPGPILVCLKGAGYTMCWPKSAGTTPWLDGNEDQVKITEYVPGGVVSAAPGDEDWFHGHFGVGGLRVLATTRGHPIATVGPPGVEVISMNADIKRGGNTIEYHDEDPMVRKLFEEALAKVGASFEMPEELYHKS